MNDQDKTKKELIIELYELRKAYQTLEKLYDQNYVEYKLLRKSFIKKQVVDGSNVLQIKPLKILIAEDDGISDLIITIVLEKNNIEVLHAKNGKEAIEACLNYPEIDLVMMDIQMPEMDGLEATRQIRKFNKDVIIIAQTAYNLYFNKENAIKAGCNDYITKPIDSELLMVLIQRYFCK